MPNYEYKCASCDATITVSQSITENPKTPKCLACKTDMSRIYLTPVVRFNGTGWAHKDGKK